jgi:hypothetical protein
VSVESGTVKYGHESRWTRTRESLRWRGPASVVKDTLILSSERMLHKGYTCKCSVETKSGRESQGTWREDELTGGKPPVVK